MLTGRSHSGCGLIEETSLADMEGSFDLIFLDSAFESYKPIVEIILARELLSKRGIILVDNGKYGMITEKLLAIN